MSRHVSTAAVLAAAAACIEETGTPCVTSRYAALHLEFLGGPVFILHGDEARLSRDRDMPLLTVPLTALVPVQDEPIDRDWADIQAEEQLWAAIDLISRPLQPFPWHGRAERTAEVTRRMVRPDRRTFCATVRTELSFRVHHQS